MKRLAMVLACSAGLNMAVPTLTAAQYYPYFSPEGGPADYYQLGRHGPYVYGDDAYVSRDYSAYQPYWQRCRTNIRRSHRHWSRSGVVSRQYCY